jgi:hypothetical protein
MHLPNRGHNTLNLSSVHIPPNAQSLTGAKGQLDSLSIRGGIDLVRLGQANFSETRLAIAKGLMSAMTSTI